MMRSKGAWIAAMLIVFAFGAAGAEGTLRYVAGITELTPGCFPKGIELSSEPLENVDWPDPLGTAYYGMLPLGVGVHAVMVDARDDEAILHIDSRLNGTVAPHEWDRTLYDGSQLASIPFEIVRDESQTASYRAFVMWSRFSPQVATYCRDSYVVGEIQFGDRQVRLAVIDEDSDGMYDDLDAGTLVLDVDGDGNLLFTSDSHEVFSLSEPFNLEGTVYEVRAMARDGSKIEIRESDVFVPIKAALIPGFPAPGFGGLDAQGKDFSLERLRGDIVVLDFWASWCGPCIYELPTLERIVTEFSFHGVQVIGVNLDRLEGDFREAVEAFDISYQQLYDTATGPIGDLYRIAGIPMTYIIDRDGLIHARGLRGDSLIEAVRRLVEGE